MTVDWSRTIYEESPSRPERHESRRQTGSTNLYVLDNNLTERVFIYSLCAKKDSGDIFLKPLLQIHTEYMTPARRPTTIHPFIRQPVHHENTCRSHLKVAALLS